MINELKCISLTVLISQLCSFVLLFFACCVIGFRPDPINFQLPLIFYFDILPFIVYTFLIFS
jgi:hypothetical protein